MDAPNAPDARPPNAGQTARLLMQHRTDLYAFIYACVRHHADAEDILQNVTVAAIESCGQLRDEAGFLPWVREIARRRISAHFRVSHRESPMDPEVIRVLSEAAERIGELSPASSHHLALLACLEQLPPASRKLICSRYTREEGDGPGLAAKFGQTIQAIYARVKRIRAALRKCVEKRLAAGGT